MSAALVVIEEALREAYKVGRRDGGVKPLMEDFAGGVAPVVLQRVLAALGGEPPVAWLTRSFTPPNDPFVCGPGGIGAFPTIARLKLIQIGSSGCTCDTKTPDIRHHHERCKYRLAEEVLAMLGKPIDLAAIRAVAGEMRTHVLSGWADRLLRAIGDAK